MHLQVDGPSGGGLPPPPYCPESSSVSGLRKADPLLEDGGGRA